MIYPQVKLKYLNTFSVDVCAYHVIQVCSESDLLTVWQHYIREGIIVLLLGGGSNVLFLENYHGTVLLNRIRGIDLLSEDEDYWHLHVCSGELWHELVIYSLQKNMPGLENLALIPGYVGAAPIQNIGAYGLDFQKFCEYVDVLNLDVSEKIRFMVDECQFGYRDSIFRNGISFNYAIVAVGLQLKKYWSPMLNYNGLEHFNVCNVTPWEIFNAVCMLRKKNLPDPLIFGNVGSFFKNPIVSLRLINDLLNKYPDIPFYVYKKNLVKLSASWLISHCCLQECKFGRAALYRNQPLVLINYDQQATPYEIIKLALYVHNEVAKHFYVFLEPEVRFIANFGEINGIELLSTEESITYCNCNY